MAAMRILALVGSLCQLAVGTIIAYDPDSYYIFQNESCRTIYSTDLVLADFLWIPALDLHIKTVSVTLPGEMKFLPRRFDTSRTTVHIHAHKLIIPAGGTVIDVSGAAGNLPSPAADGAASGENGIDGEVGETGGEGGMVSIEVGSIVGGKLTVKADGGVGGRGQDGGNGQRGAIGPGADSEACCKKGSTQGGTGGRGGDGGIGGMGGEGGVAGHVIVRLADTFQKTQPDIEVTVAVAVGGAPGNAGIGGGPGAGGAGGGTTCVRNGLFGKDRRCFLPLGVAGNQGTPGKAGTVGTEGSTGEASQGDAVQINIVPLAEVREHACDYGVVYDLFWADRLYRRGEWQETQNVMMWVEVVKQSSWCTSDVRSTEAWRGPWLQATYTAAERLQQLKLGLNFWGRSQDNVPLLSWDALVATTATQLRVSREVEELYDGYSVKIPAESAQFDSYSETIKNLDYEISTSAETQIKLLHNIQKTREEIRTLDTTVGLLEVRLGESGGVCDAAIRKKAADEVYDWQPTLMRLIGLTKKVISTHGMVVAQTGLAYAAVTLIWKSLESNAQDLSGSVKADQQSLVDREAAQIVDFKQLSLIGETPQLVNTIVQNVEQLDVTVKDNKNIAQDTFKSIQKEWDLGKMEVDETIRKMAPEESMDALRDWMKGVSECEYMFADFDDMGALAKSVDSKTSQHDQFVLEFARKELEVAKQKESRSTLSNAVAGTYDPTVFDIQMILGQNYYDMKYAVVESLQNLRAALDYEFCGSGDFTYEVSRVTQLESVFADLIAERMRKQNTDASARTLIGRYPDFETSTIGSKPDPVTVIKLTHSVGGDEKINAAFDDYYARGTFKFDMTNGNPALPQGVANARVTGVQAYIPALMKDNGGTVDERGLAEVWIKRQGVSRCSDVRGNKKVFSHSDRSYYSMYSVSEDASAASFVPKWLTTVVRNADAVNPTPTGIWEVSIPSLSSEAERRRVTHIEFHFLLSVVPCANPQCAQDSTQALNTMKVLNSSLPIVGGRRSTMSPVAMLVSLIAVSAMFMVVAIAGLSTSRSIRSSGQTIELETRVG